MSVSKKLPVKSLVMEAYQRPTNDSMIKRAANDTNFDEILFRPIEVAVVGDGTFAVIDGQHRVEIAKLRRIRNIDCRIHDGLSYEERAEYFIKANWEKTNLTAIDRFNARIEAKDPDALSLKTLVEAAGFIIRRGGSTTAIGAIFRLEQMYKLSAAWITDALSIARLFVEGEDVHLNADVMGGIHAFLAQHGKNVDQDRLIRVLSKRRQHAWIITTTRGQSKELNIRVVAHEIQSAYNRNLGETRKLVSATYGWAQ